jgi:hypothetical protein
MKDSERIGDNVKCIPNVQAVFFHMEKPMGLFIGKENRPL